MSGLAPLPARQPGAAAPAPRALIDYDFESVLDAPPRRRVVLWLMAGLLAAAAEIPVEPGNNREIFAAGVVELR